MKSEIVNSERSEDRVDAFTAEVIRSAVVAITTEMKTNLMRTAYHTIIYEAEDFTVGLFDADGNTISIGLGLPMFIRGLSDAIKAKIAHWGKENIEPDDILLTNDSYIMGSHLNHMIFTLPIFNDGELVAFSSSMAHWQDIGGQLGGVTRDIFSEGLQMPFVKSFRAGKENPEITAIIKANVRVPERAMGDMRAQLASIRTGERRVMQLLKRYGNQAFKDSIELVYEQSEKLARAAVRQIPDGVYEAESFMDDDGVNHLKHIPIKVRVEVRDDEMTIDLSDVSPQVAGYYNSGVTAGLIRRRSCFQMHHDAAAFADQRRFVPSAEDHTSAGPRGERHQAGAGARVDDRADDRVRHDFSSAGSRMSGPHHRRPLRRPLHREPARLRRRDRAFLLVAYRSPRRRLGRQARRRRHERDGLPQRR